MMLRCFRYRRGQDHHPHDNIWPDAVFGYCCHMGFGFWAMFVHCFVCAPFMTIQQHADRKPHKYSVLTSWTPDRDQAIPPSL